MHTNASKAISPLIAVVILVGFVVAIAVLLWPWLSKFVKKRTRKEEESLKKLCTGAASKIMSVESCNFTGAEDRLQLKIENPSAAYKLYNFTAELRVANGTAIEFTCKSNCPSENNPLAPGDIRFPIFNGTGLLANNTLTWIRIVPENCRVEGASSPLVNSWNCR